MANAECFVLMLPLRECAGRCHVCLKTAYTMRHRLIECLSAYSPSFKTGRGCGCELDETYFPESFKGNHTKGSFTMPRHSRHRGKQVHRRGLSRERICVMTGVNDSNETFLEVSGRGILSRKRAVDVLRDRIASASVVATDKASAYVDVLAELEVAAHTAHDSKDCSEGTINRINTVHSLLDTFMKPFKACRRSTSAPTSLGSRGAGPSWRSIPAPQSAQLRDSSPTACAGAASAICSTSCRPTLTTGPKPPHRDGRMVASRYTRKVQPCRRTYRPRRSRSTRRPKRRPGHLGRARPVHFHRRQRVPQGARPGGRDAVRDEGQDAGARREDGEIAGKSTWGDGTLTIDPTDL